jgi:hypothetical protein
MRPAPRTQAGRTIFSLFAVQAVLTALFGLLAGDMVHGPAARDIAIVAAVLCLGVGLVAHYWPSPATWLLALGFEIAFVVAGVAVFAVWHIYLVGTIVAILNIVRLSQSRAAFAGPRAGVPGYGQPSSLPPGCGQPSFPPPGYGQPHVPPGYDQPDVGQGYGMMPPGQPPHPGTGQSLPPDGRNAQDLQ